MRKQWIMLSLMAGTILLGGYSSAQAEDDVYINWSVIDELKNSNQGSASAPLFPEIKKTTSTSKAKPRAQKAKPAPKKAATSIYGPAILKTEPKTKVQDLKLKPVSENMEHNAASPVAEIAKETLPEIIRSEDLNSETAQVAAQPINQNAFEPTPTTDTISTPAAQNNPVISTPAEPAISTNTIPVQAPLDPVVSTPPAIQSPEPEAVQPQLLLPVSKSVAPSSTLRAINFADDSTELTTESQQRLDQLLQTFENPKANKIAIYSYNYDNGEDVFRKKRLSLNRAVEIRSYLLGKGHKNFSIKVINITEDADKRNLVEVEELK